MGSAKQPIAVQIRGQQFCTSVKLTLPSKTNPDRIAIDVIFTANMLSRSAMDSTGTEINSFQPAVACK